MNFISGAKTFASSLPFIFHPVAKTMKTRLFKSLLLLGIAPASTIFAGTPDTVPAEATKSAEVPKTRTVFSVLDDNDFYGKWSDKYYTNHTRFALTLDSHYANKRHNVWFFSVGQEIYTPKNYYIPVPDSRDHPYAGYLYGSVGIASYDDDFAVFKELQLGVTGDWAIAKQTQHECHALKDEFEPLGWDTQIHNRVVAQAIADIRKRFVLSGACGSEDYGADFVVRGFGGLGNLRGIMSAGAQLRVGWNLPKDFGYSPMRQSASAVLDPQVDASIYAFLDLGADAVLWDKTLTGNNGNGSNINPYPFVGELSIGVNMIYDRYMLTLFQTVRSKDFSTQDKDFFVYGGIKLSICF